MNLASRYWKNYNAFLAIIPNPPLPSVQNLLLNNMQICDGEQLKMTVYFLLLISGDFCPKAVYGFTEQHNRKRRNIGIWFWRFKFSRWMHTGHANLMERHCNDSIRMLFDSEDMITKIRWTHFMLNKWCWYCCDISNWSDLATNIVVVLFFVFVIIAIVRMSQWAYEQYH